jgi:hypothetical protein
MLRCCDAAMLRCCDAAMLRCCDAAMLRCCDAAMLRCCDAAMFEQLHAVSKAAKDESELRRYYSALMSVQNSGLAQQAARFKLAEIK